MGNCCTKPGTPMIEIGNNHSRNEPRPSDYANDSDDSGGRDAGDPVLARRFIPRGH